MRRKEIRKLSRNGMPVQLQRLEAFDLGVGIFSAFSFWVVGVRNASLLTWVAIAFTTI